MALASNRYRYFCCGVVITSISWCFIIIIYATHLESVARSSISEQRAQVRAFGGVIEHPANIPFPDVPEPIEKNQADWPVQQQVKRSQKRVKVHGHYHIIDDDDGKQRQAAMDGGNEHPDDRRENHVAKVVEQYPIDKDANGFKEYVKDKWKKKRMGVSDEVDRADPNGERPVLDPGGEDGGGEAGVHAFNPAATPPLPIVAHNLEMAKRISPEIVQATTHLAEVDRAVHAKAQVPVPKKAPIDLAELGMVKSPEDQQKRDYGFHMFAFNSLISDRIGERRDLLDSRHALCKSQVYPSDLPKASIIICYYNEAPSALIRMVNSIIDRTPHNVIEEILLIDDQSDPGVTEPKLTEYADAHWGTLGFVKRTTTNRREGLIRAKVYGSHLATGEVLVFLDSHCEVMPQWLEPLLARLKDHPHTVVCPIIDIIEPDTFKYAPAPVCMGGFEWNLHFKWDYPPWTYFKTDADYIKPLMSPTMAGGLFAMRRDYFRELGEYDTGMDIWGGENVEISFRIWTCGGRLEIIPCSRIGHIFRKRRPYNDPSGIDTTSKNLVRVALVWLDEFEEKFFEHNRYLRQMNYGNISARVALRKSLQCKPFRWYLENIYPALLNPTVKVHPPSIAPLHLVDGTASDSNQRRFYIAMVADSAIPAGFCLGTYLQEVSQKKARVMLLPCPSEGIVARNLIWHLTDSQELRLAGGLCLDSTKGVRVMKCDMQLAYQEWKMKNMAGPDAPGDQGLNLYNPAIGQCLYAEPRSTDKSSFFVRMSPCEDSEYQRFKFHDL